MSKIKTSYMTVRGMDLHLEHDHMIPDSSGDLDRIINAICQIKGVRGVNLQVSPSCAMFGWVDEPEVQQSDGN